MTKLVGVLKKPSKSDPLAVCTTKENGENVVADRGEPHVEIYFTVSDPVMFYRETVSKLSNQVCFIKSPNEHNRPYITAEPMDEVLCKSIEASLACPKANPKDQAKLYRDKSDGNEMAAHKIWAWGTENEKRQSSG